MAFLHCHNCLWSQGDFWEVPESQGGKKYGYMTIQQHDFDTWIRLLSDAVQDPLNKLTTTEFDKSICRDYFGTCKEIDVRQYVAWAMECRAKTIRNMHWLTYEQFKADPHPRCPNCGSRNLDID